MGEEGVNIMLTLNQVMTIYAMAGNLQEALLQADLVDDAQKVTNIVIDLMEKDLSEAATKPEHIKLLTDIKEFRSTVERMMNMQKAEPEVEPTEESDFKEGVLPTIVVLGKGSNETH